MAKIKVMVVDDSALVRKLMTELLSSDKEIEVIAQARDPIYALEKLKKMFYYILNNSIFVSRYCYISLCF